MKTAALVILVALLSCSCSKRTEESNGRFQMCSDAAYAYVIDTRTGQVWGQRHSGSGGTYIGDGKKFAQKKIGD
jgi:hypothetical protein